MSKKGYVCTNCGSKKRTLTPALESECYRRRRQYGEQRCIEDDNSNKKPDVVEKSGSIKYKDKMEPRHSNRSKSCAPMVSSPRRSRRTDSPGRVQQEPIYVEISPSSASDFGRLLNKYCAYDDDEADTDDYPKDYETDDDNIHNYRHKETKSFMTKKSILKTSSKKKDKKPNDLTKKVKEKKEIIDKLNGMRERLNSEYERAQSELKQLQYDNFVKQELKKDKRERGGAHFILSEISDSYTKREEQTKSKYITRESHIMQSMKEEKLPKSSSSMESDLTLSYSPPTSTTAIKDPFRLRQYLTPIATRTKSMPWLSSEAWRCLNKFPRICYALSTAQRALYQGFTDLKSSICEDNILALRRGHWEKIEHIDDPFCQFTAVPCNRKEILYLLLSKPEASKQNNVGKELYISRAPVYCPDHDCRRITFISDFSRHLLYNHRGLTTERVDAGHSKTFFMDSRAIQLNNPKSYILYLVRGKIMDSHSRKLKNLLPVLVMMTRVRLSEMIGPSSAMTVSHDALNAELYVFWLASFIPNDQNITGTICVWSTRKSQLVESLYVHTSEVYDIRQPQDICSIWSSTSTLVIPSHIVNRMTNHGKTLMAIQTEIH